MMYPEHAAFAGYHSFENGDGEEHGSFEVFWMDREASSRPATTDEAQEPGWYWWACFPGCLPDGEPSGPFETSTAAYEDARFC